MRPILLPLAALLLAACGVPQERAYLRAGADATEVERAYLSCAARAQREFPPRRVGGTVSISIGSSVCRGAFCVGAGNPGWNDPYRRDPTEGLRERTVDVCMAEQGFAPVDLPRCPSGLPVQPVAVQPVTTADLCASNGRISSPVPAF